MGALFGKTGSNSTVNQTVPDPEKTADPTEIGGSRKAEDNTLFGTTAPSNTVNRTTTPASVPTGGSGLKLM